MTTTPIRRTPATAAHRRLGAAFREEAAWEIAAGYGDAAAEAARLTETVGLTDITARAKVDVRGRIEDVLPAVDGALVARLAPDWAMVFGPPGDEDRVIGALEAVAGPGTMVTDATHLFAGHALAGPLVPDAVARLSGWDLATLSPGHATGAPLGGMRAVVISRTLTFPCLEVYVATEFGHFAWETFLSTVTGLGGGAVGWDMLTSKGWS